jgi:hypothetical protein
MILLESIFVGFYTFIIGFIFYFKINIPYLFIIGFIKHFVGYYIGLHDYECYPLLAINKYIVYDSILEGLLLIITGLLLKLIIKNKYIFYFMIGFLLHLSFEYAGLHKIFKKNRCI